MGTWAPVFRAKFAQPLLNQIIAIIQRDQGSALAVVNADREGLGYAPLKPIQEFHKGPGARSGWPWLFVALGPTLFDEETNDFERKFDASVRLDLDVGQYNQEQAQEDAQDFARMLDMVLMTSWMASSPDWKNPLAIQLKNVPGGKTSPNAPGTVKRMFIESHIPGPVAIEGVDAPVMRVSLTLIFTLVEAAT